MPCPLPRRTERVRVSIASPLMQPSPNGRRVGIRIVTIEACSGFTHVTARRIAQPPKAAFVARLRPGQLPDRAARQLPDLSTTIPVEPSSTDGSSRQGARRVEDGRGSLGHSATLRFPSPLIEPDVPISGIRLSDRLHREAHGGTHHGRRSRHSTPRSPCSTSNENRWLPRPAILCRLTRKARTRSRT